MNIRVLIRHIDEQIAHGDARAPNAEWIVNELKKYIQSKEILDDSIDEIKECEWCRESLKGNKLTVVIENVGRYRVCPDCLNDYANQEYDTIISRAKKSAEQKSFEVGDCDEKGMCSHWDVHSGCCSKEGDCINKKGESK